MMGCQRLTCLARESILWCWNLASELTNVHCRPMQMEEKDFKWGNYLMDNLPDNEDDDDLTQDNNRQGLPCCALQRNRIFQCLGVLFRFRVEVEAFGVGSYYEKDHVCDGANHLCLIPRVASAPAEGSSFMESRRRMPNP